MLQHECFYYGLDLKYVEKVHMRMAWLPACCTIGECWDLQMVEPRRRKLGYLGWVTEGDARTMASITSVSLLPVTMRYKALTTIFGLP